MLFTCRSRTLLAIGKTEMGLYPASTAWSFPLGIGTILAVFHSVGNTPVEIDRLNKVVSDEVILSAVDLSIFAVTESQPVDLDVSTSARRVNTVSSVHNSSFGQLSGLRYSKEKSELVRGGKLWLKQV